MRPLVDVTTTVAFLSAPLFAWLNCKAIATGDVPPEAAPPKWLRVLSWAGVVFLTCFSILFLVVYFGFRG
jgi:Mn2+/Fe2+ NRAMP family transporter